MRLGRFTIEQLSEGRFEIFSDGTINREPVGKAPEKRDSIAAQTSVSARIGINPILVLSEEHNILLDCGLGWGLDAGSGYKDVSNVITNLDIFDISPEEITHVVLSHLHYDHAAGSSFTDKESRTCPTFPNATYFVQKKEWEYALSQQEVPKNLLGADYLLDDLYRLVADDRFEFLNVDCTEIVDGIKVLWTGGHTPGHQVARIEDQGKTAYYLGDLLPSENHLNQYSMRQMDETPLQAKKMKVQLLRTAFEEKALLLFYHSLFSSAGRLERDHGKKYVLKKLK